MEIDQEKSVKSVKSVVEMAYFRVESIFARRQYVIKNRPVSGCRTGRLV